MHKNVYVVSMNWVHWRFCSCEQIICLSSQISVSCLNLPSSSSLPPLFSVIYHLLGTRQGFLKSGLSSGKTLWPAASASYNLSSHMVKREDLQKGQGWKQENQVGRRGKGKKAEANKGRRSFGTALGKGTSTVPLGNVFLSLSLFQLFFFLCPPAIFRITVTFPRCLDYWEMWKCNLPKHYYLPEHVLEVTLQKCPIRPHLFLVWSD